MVIAPIREPKSGPGYQIAYGPSDQHLTWTGKSGHPRAGHDPHSADLRSKDLALAGMDAGADLDPECAHGIGDLECAADAARWTVERREESVPGVVDLASTEACELLADDRMVSLEGAPPPVIAE